MVTHAQKTYIMFSTFPNLQFTSSVLKWHLTNALLNMIQFNFRIRAFNYDRNKSAKKYATDIQ